MNIKLSKFSLDFVVGKFISVLGEGEVVNDKTKCQHYNTCL